MAKIKQLSQHEAQKIAAGEVIERPANIVKELLENSIDAGATRISLYIEDAGKQLIRVVDNGCGMDATDARICFDRHATSKITQVDELETINTFGFRGEALASIASVSQISLETKEAHTIEGTRILIDANSIKETSIIACNTGTDIAIRNLFFNVPARKKFLKSVATEWRAIQLLFNAFCFDYPHIHFALFTEGKQVNNCPSVDTVEKRALQIWEPTTHNHIIPLNPINDTSCTITGIISDHQHYRYDRSGIYLFVNKRWIKNSSLMSAIIKGYANVIPEGRAPVAALNITVPAHEVDINIHPRKEEVKFLHPRKIEQAIQQAIKATLEKNLSRHLKKEVSFTPTQQHPHFASAQQPHYAPFNFDSFFTQPTRFVAPEQISVINDNPFPISETIAVPTAVLETQHTVPFASFAQETPTTENYRLIGQYDKTYLLLEKEDGLFLIDQHAAHERILYELFANRFTKVATVQLLFPHVITLTTSDLTIITPHLGILSDNGILVEQCASNQLIVQSLPVHLKEHSINDLIKEMISWIVEEKSIEPIALKKIINNKLQAQMACKAAVKAGDELTREKMEQLLIDLHKTANRFSCPHGRPTGWLFSLHEIEKKFRRKL